jgi:hypothetical protein
MAARLQRVGLAAARCPSAKIDQTNIFVAAGDAHANAPRSPAMT